MDKEDLQNSNQQKVSSGNRNESAEGRESGIPDGPVNQPEGKTLQAGLGRDRMIHIEDLEDMKGINDQTESDRND